MDGPARITDVAQAAGVSATTVSNVLNRPHKVAAGTREKVQKVIQNLEYVPNPNAAALPKRRQKQDLPEVTSQTQADPSRLQTLLEAPSSPPDTEATGSTKEPCLDWESLKGGEMVEILFRNGITVTGLVDIVMPDHSLIWLWMDNGQGRTMVRREDAARIKRIGRWTKPSLAMGV